VKIEIQRDACVGAGQCALVAGDVFDQDDDGIVLLMEPVPPAHAEAAVRRAASLCPARAIHIDE